MERLAVTAKLKPDSSARVSELIKEGPPFDLAAAGFDRHAVYFGNDQVVFVFEAERAERLVDNVVNDPAISAAFSAWAPILDGPPTLARPVYHWERTKDGGTLHWDEGWQ
jgi:hypothetical protein